MLDLMEVGVRVVRGPDWSSDAEESDGGEGFVGTVVEVGGKSSSLPKNLVWVQWDSGIRHDHRAGYYEAYDLYVLDSATAGIYHTQARCDGCQESPILGMRWHCLDCTGTRDLCTSCYMADKHYKNHNFERMDSPDHEGIKVGVRLGEKRIQAKGIFQGAKVKRGRDWKYDDRQDGGEGKQGVVKDVTEWQHTPRSAVVVSWDEAGQNKYRLGFKGKVDVMCVSPSIGCCYYKSHLPKFGEKQKKKVRSDSTTGSGHENDAKIDKTAFVVGDEVLVDIYPGLLKSLTEKHARWDEDMRKYVGKVGEVHSFTSSGNVTISYDDGAVWTFPRNVLAKPDERSKKGESRVKRKDVESDARRGRDQMKAASKTVSLEGKDGMRRNNEADGNKERKPKQSTAATFKLGDIVRLLDNEKAVKRLQSGHGPWNAGIRECLGMVGRVMNVDSDGDVGVRIDGKTNVIVVNPAALCWPESQTESRAANEDTKPAIAAESRKSTKSSKSSKTRDPEKNGPRASRGERESPRKVSQEQTDRGKPKQQQQQQRLQHQPQKPQQQQQQQQQRQRQQQQQQQRPPAPQQQQQRQGQPPQQYHQEQKQQHDQQQQSEQQGENGELCRYFVANAAGGNVSGVRAILQQNPEIIDRVAGGHTALHQACHGGHFDVVSVLLNAGASLIMRDLSGYTALHHSAYGDYNGETANLLISVGADKDDSLNQVQNTPLHLAVERHNSMTAVALIKAGCEVNKKNINGVTALHEAVRLGNILIVESLLRAPAVDLTIVNRKGMNPFLMAVERKYKGAIIAMVKMFPDMVKVAHVETGMTPLHYAAANDDSETAALLLKTGKCELDAHNKTGVSAYELAVSMNKTSVAVLLDRYRDDLLRGVSSGASFDQALPASKVFREICVGDTVRVIDDEKTVEMLQAGHGGYNFSMSLVTGKLGTIIETQMDGDVLVYFEDLNLNFVMNPTILELVVPLECSCGGHDGAAANDATRFVYTGEDTSPPPAISNLHPMFEIMLKMKTVLRPQHKEERDTVGLLFHAVMTNWKSRVREILGPLPGLVNARLDQRTPLHVACLDGSVEVAEMLLDSGAHVESQDDCGFTPLHFSVFGDRSGETVKLLVSRGAKVDANLNIHFASPVSTAVLRCNEAAVKILIQSGCDLNLQDGYGDTPLHAAVRTEKDSITGMLLSSPNVNPNIFNNSGLNPLHMAVVHGNEAIVRKFVQGAPGLLEIPDASDYGRTALHYACLYNHPGVAEILLDTDLCDIHAVDATNYVPLAWANVNHMHSVVQRFIEKYESEVSSSQSEASGAMACGAGPSESEAGAEPMDGADAFLGEDFEVGDIVKVHSNLELLIALQPGLRDWADEISKTLGGLGEVILVEGGDIIGVMVDGIRPAFLYHRASLKLISKARNPRKKSDSSAGASTSDVGESSLRERRETVVRQRQEEVSKKTTTEGTGAKDELPARKEDAQEGFVDAMVDHTQLGGMLLKFTAMGHVAKVKKFVQTNPDMLDYKPFGYSALHLACQDGFGDIIRILIESGAKKDIQDSSGLNPLQAAAVHDKSGVAASTLLDFKFDPNLATADGCSPLHLAVLRDNEATARVLVQRGCDVNLLDGDGNTALHHAVAHGKDKLVDVILEGPSLPLLCNNGRGFSALHMAAEDGNEYATRKLSEHYPQMVNEPSENGSTPLHLAASQGRQHVVEALLDTAGIDINLRDRSKKTALQLAEEAGREDTIDLLIERGATFDGYSGFIEESNRPEDLPSETAMVERVVDSNADLPPRGQNDHHCLPQSGKAQGSSIRLDSGTQPLAESLGQTVQGSPNTNTNPQATKTEGEVPGFQRSAFLLPSPNEATGVDQESKTPVITEDGLEIMPSKYVPTAENHALNSDSWEGDARENSTLIATNDDERGDESKQSTKSNVERSESAVNADGQHQISECEVQFHDDYHSGDEDVNKGADEDTESSPSTDQSGRSCSLNEDAVDNSEGHTAPKGEDLESSVPIQPPLERHAGSRSSDHSPEDEDAVEQANAGEPLGLPGEMESGDLDTDGCLVCKQGPANVKYHPCQHIVTCPGCSSQVSNCPRCSTAVTKRTIEELSRPTEDEGCPSLGKDKCCICWDKKKNVTFQCGHLCTCRECSEEVTTCPLCTKEIRDRITTFY